MNRSRWIDALRGIAIIAVVFDHAFFLFPQFRNDVLWWHTYFSVPWFVFLAGVTNAFARKRREWLFPQSWIKYWFRRIIVLIWYVGISFFIFWVDSKNSFDSSLFFDHLLNFSIEPTYYFINLILQLYFVFPLVVSLVIVGKNRLSRLGLIVLSWVLAEMLLLKIPAPWPFSPPGNLLGGLYFPVFVAGVVFAYEDLIVHKTTLLTGGVIFLWFEFVLIQTNGGFISIVQSIPLLLWSVSALILVAKILKGFVKSHVVRILSLLGKQSLPIYLTHFFFLRHLATLPQNNFEFLGLIITSIVLGSLVGFIPAYTMRLVFAFGKNRDTSLRPGL